MGCGCSKSHQYEDNDIDELHLLKDDPAAREHHSQQLVRCTLIGDVAVGKTALMLKMSEALRVVQYIPTIGVDFRACQIGPYKLQIWDSSGQSSFDLVRSQQMTNSNSVIYCFDLTNQQSFDNLSTRWKREVEKYSNDSPKVLVGTKFDCKDRIESLSHEAQQLAEDWNIRYFETSIYVDSKEETERNERIVDGFINEVQSENEWKLPESVTRCLHQFYYLCLDPEKSTQFEDVTSIFTAVCERTSNGS